MLRTPPRDHLSRSATINRSYADQLEQEILKNLKLRRLWQKARRQSRRHEHQLKDLEDTVNQHENDLQEPWAESHRLRNQLRELERTKDDTITSLRSTISTKDAELADVAVFTRALGAQLSEAQAKTHITLNELDHLQSVERTNHELRTENATLTSRIKVLKRDLATQDNMRTHYTTRLERLSARNTELKKSLENSLRETDEAQKSLEDYSSKHKCLICTSAEADRLTRCGHLFCKECLDTWEEDWHRKTYPYGGMQGTRKGILTCPTCREWVLMSTVKHIYHT